MEFRKMVMMALYVRQQRDIDVKKKDFWTLWEKVRVG